MERWPPAAFPLHPAAGRTTEAMTLRSLRIAALVLIMMLSPAGVRAFGVNDVIKLQKEQVSDSLIVLAIQKSGDVIRVSSNDFRRLKQAGVSDPVMSALLRSEQVGFQKNADVNAYGWSTYPYGTYPHSRFALDLT